MPVAVLAALLLTCPDPSTPGIRPPPPDADREQLVDQGWAQLHDLDYVNALVAFQTLQRLEPESPRAYLYQAVATWLQELERQQDLEVSSFIDSTHFGERERAREDPLARERFEALVERASERARARLEQDPDDVESLYLLGGTHGVRASYEVTVGHNASAALKAARESWRTQKAVVAKDPSYYDAYLTLGLYDYVTGSLPFYVKWIAFLAGYRGDKKAGIHGIELAAQNGKRASRDAKAILTVIYAREGRLEDALQIFEELKLAAPHNQVLRINRAWILFRLGRYHEAADSYAEAIAVARPEARFKREEVRLLQAYALLQAGEPGTALAITRGMLAVEVLDAALAVRTRLLSAQCLDALGRREEAVAIYREVAAAKSVDGSRTAARRGLRKPFQPATPPDLGQPAGDPASEPAATP